MSTSAKLKDMRISPQKVRLVADQIRGLQVDQALSVLTFSNKKAAVLLKKVLNSAISNAEHNQGADIDELRISEIVVDVSTTMKRLHPRARGRADRIIKRTSRVRVTVSEVAE